MTSGCRHEIEDAGVQNDDNTGDQPIGRRDLGNGGGTSEEFGSSGAGAPTSY